MSARSHRPAGTPVQELDRIFHELEALAETDAGARACLREIAHASAELRGAVQGMVPAVRELEVRMDLDMDERRGEGVEGFDPLEMDRYSLVHETCRGLSEQAADLQGLRAQIDGSRVALEAHLAQRATRLGKLREAVRRIGPLDLAQVLDDACQQAVALGAAHGVSVQVEGAPQGVTLEPAQLAGTGALLCAVLRCAVLRARGRAAGAQAALPIRVDFSHEGSELLIALRDGGDGDVLLPDAHTGAQSAEGPDDADLAREVARLTRRARLGGARIAIHDGALHVHVPTSAGEQPLLFVRAGDWILALPMRQLRSVIRVVDAAGFDDGALLLEDGERAPMVDLAAFATCPSPAPDVGARAYAALGGPPGAPLALLFDRIEGHARSRIMPLADPLPRLSAAIGAVVLDEGRTVMVLDTLATSLAEPVAATPSAAPVAATPCILVVDDSITIRKVAERMLGRNGLRVQVARDGREALEQIPAAPPDLILLDIEMPRMNGFQFLEALRADPVLRTIPVIMISSRVGEKHREEAKRLGAGTFLGKPFKERELMAAIAQMLQWQP